MCIESIDVFLKFDEPFDFFRLRVNPENQIKSDQTMHSLLVLTLVSFAGLFRMLLLLFFMKRHHLGYLCQDDRRFG